MAAAAKKGGMSPEQQLLSAARALASRARLGFSDDDITARHANSAVLGSDPALTTAAALLSQSHLAACSTRCGSHALTPDTPRCSCVLPGLHR